MKKENYEFYQNEPVDSIVELLERSERLYGDSIAVEYRKKKEIFQKSYVDLVRDSKRVAEVLLQKQKADDSNLQDKKRDDSDQNKNIKDGSMPAGEGHVALLGGSSYAWLCGYFGIMYAGMVAVPMDKELSAASLGELIQHAQVWLLLYDDEYADVAKTLQAGENRLKLLSMEELREDKVKPEYGQIFPEVQPDKMAAIVYTSGTTGKSKGVILSQKNIARNVICGLGAINPKHGEDVILSVLPFHHMYEMTCTILGMLYQGVKICISGGLKSLSRDFAQYQPTVMCVVPLFVERLYQRIMQTAEKEHKDKKLMMAIRICRTMDHFGLDARNKLLKEVRAVFGGRLRMVMCGGAPLSEELICAYRDFGINLIQGYGLTECSPLLTANMEWYHRSGSVGKIVMYCEAKAVEGEIWAKGLTVSKGYYHNEEANRESFEDGYFKTGDLGYIDEDGFVFLTGRKKNLIILSNGENVAAEELEEKIMTIPYVKEVIVYEKNRTITAEIYFQEEKEQEGKEKIHEDIGKLNRELPVYKNIAEIVIRETEFPKTTTQKIIRNHG